MIKPAKFIKPQFSDVIELALTEFLSQHQAHLPNDLHSLAIQSIEKPLFKMIMQHTEQNQSQAAKILGVNRATLRKKLIEYGMLKE
jgi:Fis family transcriptional regulator